MANTISTYCKEYVNDELELLKIFNTNSLTQDLLKGYIKHTGKIISYDSVSFSAAAVVGSFSRSSGYTDLDITATRVDKTLSQDIGNALKLDIMDRDEAQIEKGIIGLYNRYVVKLLIPTVDKYRLSAIAPYNSKTEVVGSALTASTIISKLLADKKKMGNNRVKWEECIVYMGETNKSLLDEASLGKGYLELGNWNGNMDATVEKFKGAKIVTVPDSWLPSSVNYICIHPLAAAAFVVHQEAEFFDKIPGHGGRMLELDVGFYHDCWLEPAAADTGVVVNVTATRA